MSCFVKSCKNVKRLLPPDSSINFFRFPRDERFKLWLNAIGLSTNECENLNWRKSMLICSSHFRPDDLRRSSLKSFVKTDAIPTLKLCEENETDFNEDPKSIIQKVETEIVSPDANKDLNPIHIKTENTHFKQDIDSDYVNDEIGDIAFIRIIHSYSTSPGSVKKQLDNKTDRLRKMTKKFYNANKTIKKQRKRILQLKNEIRELRKLVPIPNVGLNL